MKKAKQTTLTGAAAVISAVCILYAVISFLVYVAARNTPDTVYMLYTSKIYRIVTFPDKLISSVIPFSVSETLLILIITVFLAGFIASLIMLLYRTVKKLPGRAAPVLRFFICIPAVFGIICGRFVWLGGMNYSSLSFKELAEYDTVNTDTAVLKKLCAYLGKKASEARNQLDTDDSGAVYSRCSVPEILSVSQTGYEDLKEIYPFFDMYTVSPKPALFSEIMCYEQISGIFPIVYTESLVNAKTPVAELPHTACHELAHQYGFMQEDEANFIGYLACINSDDVLYIYSGYYTAFRYAMSQLYSYDKDAWQEIAEAVDPGIYTDISKGNSFWSSYEDKVEVIAAVSESVNNAYLQANNISDGTHSYGRMVDLLIAEYRGIL